MILYRLPLTFASMELTNASWHCWNAQGHLQCAVPEHPRHRLKTSPTLVETIFPIASHCHFLCNPHPTGCLMPLSCLSGLFGPFRLAGDKEHSTTKNFYCFFRIAALPAVL